MKRRLIRLFAAGALTFIRWGILHGLWKTRAQNERLLSIILDLRMLQLGPMTDEEAHKHVTNFIHRERTQA